MPPTSAEFRRRYLRGEAQNEGAFGSEQQRRAKAKQAEADESRGTARGLAERTAIDEAYGTRRFLEDEATGFANMLMPELTRGLAATRSRFSGGGIRSGGAQQAEENTFMRLFTNPLTDKISQLSRFSAEFGQSEAQRRFGNMMDLGRFDLDAAGQAAGIGGQARNRFFGILEGDVERDFEADQRKKERRAGALGALGGGLGRLATMAF